VKFYILVCMGVGRNFFRGATNGFFLNVFLGGGKSGEIWFSKLETKKTAFFAEIFKFLPLFRHPWFYGGKVRETPLKNFNFKRFNRILNSVICWILYAKWNIWQINFNCAFVFALERLNSWIGIVTDNLLVATYALSCLCIPVLHKMQPYTVAS